MLLVRPQGQWKSSAGETRQEEGTMRTSVLLDEEIVHKLEQIAADHGEPLTSFLEEVLQDILRREQSRQRKSLELPTFRGTGLHPGADLDDSASLLDLMERADAPR
jgi:hypothetical protein